jgi:oxygen-dependent protoporphyrinogen oxidase
MATIGILGGGISGLTAAYRLQQQGIDVRVLEASDRVGGMIRTEQRDGFLVEHGPNSLRPTPAVLPRTLHDLELTSEVVSANEVASTRYVVRDGTPTPLPMSLRAFLTTDLLSTTAKLRLLTEPFRRTGTGVDESVASFVQRRLGHEVLDYAVNPFVGGVFAGNPADLSVRHAFERLFTMEREHGSLLRGALHAARTRSDAATADVPDTPSGLFSFRDGLETLPQALADALGDRITRNAAVTAIRPDGAQCRVTVDTDDGSDTQAFDAVICTVPLHRLSALDLDTPVDCRPLTQVSYPPVSVLALGLARDDVVHPLDGFGMLVPAVEDDYRILGTIFSSTLFPERAPEDHVLLTTFAGGARDPDLGAADTDALQAVVERDLDALLGLRGAPTFVRHVQWARAIPQYSLDHSQVTATLDAIEDEHPRLFFAGNYRTGVSVGDAMASGADAAERVMREA